MRRFLTPFETKHRSFPEQDARLQESEPSLWAATYTKAHITPQTCVIIRPQFVADRTQSVKAEALIWRLWRRRWHCLLEPLSGLSTSTRGSDPQSTFAGLVKIDARAQRCGRGGASAKPDQCSCLTYSRPFLYMSASPSGGSYSIETIRIPALWSCLLFHLAEDRSSSTEHTALTASSRKCIEGPCGVTMCTIHTLGSTCINASLKQNLGSSGHDRRNSDSDAGMSWCRLGDRAPEYSALAHHVVQLDHPCCCILACSA